MVLSGDTSGAVTLTVPAVAGTNTVTIPAATGTVMVSGNMPAFSAYGSATQTFANSTFTKVAYNTKSFDTNTNYDATTNYRFTPTVAGYYQLSAVCSFASSVTGAVILSLYKNGGEFIRGAVATNTNSGPVLNISNLVYANGSTDYFEIWGWQNSGGNLACGSSGSSAPFSGCLIRAA
jgi:hypothetical protein